MRVEDGVANSSVLCHSEVCGRLARGKGSCTWHRQQIWPQLGLDISGSVIQVTAADYCVVDERQSVLAGGKQVCVDPLGETGTGSVCIRPVTYAFAHLLLCRRIPLIGHTQVPDA